MWWDSYGSSLLAAQLAFNQRLMGVAWSALTEVIVANTVPNVINVERDLLIPYAVTGTSQQMVPGYDYTTENAVATVVCTLPVLCDKGKVMRITGVGVGGWALALNANQIVHFGNLDTTTGVTGGISSNARYDSITIRCVVANLEFSVIASQGSMEVV